MMALPSKSEISWRVRRAIEASGSGGLFDDVVGVRFRIRGAAQRSDDSDEQQREGDCWLHLDCLPSVTSYDGGSAAAGCGGGGMRRPSYCRGRTERYRVRSQ